MATLYELQVVEGHRYNELPIRLKNGTKVSVSKDKVTIIGSGDLAKGEEFTIARYEAEGRFLVKRVEPEPTAKAKRDARRRVATDAARKLARANGLELSEMVGTGADGKITVGDVRLLLPEV